MLHIILGFAFLIFIHELGHFMVARWCGIRCPQFAIGFGQSLLTFRKGIGFRVGSTETEYANQAFAQLEKTRGPLDEDARKKVDLADLHAAADALNLGQTEYRLNWIPLGGYVKMVGQEDTDPNAKSKDPASFGNKSTKARAAVLIAGIVMNLIAGLVFLVIAFSGGVDFPSATVGGVAHGSPAEKAGLRIGDKIASVDGEAITDYLDLKMRVVLASKDKPIALGIVRDEQAQTVAVTPEFNAAQGMQAIGMAPSWKLTFADLGQAKLKPEEKKEWESTPFGKFDAGDAISSINGEKVADYAQLCAAVNKSEGKEIEVGVKTAAGEKTVTVRPEMDPELLMAAKPPGKDGEAQIAYPLGLLPLTRIGSVAKGSPAQAAGLAKGDILLAVDGREYPTFAEFSEAAQKAGAQGVAITVERDGKKLPTIAVKPRATGKLAFLGLGRKAVGIVQEFAQDDTRFIADAQNSHAPPRGSRLLTLDGKPVAHWNDVQRLLQGAAHTGANGEAVDATLAMNAGTEPATAQFSLPLSPALRASLSRATWSLPQAPLAADEVKVKGDGLLDSARIGVRKTRDSVVQIYLTIGRLLQGSVSGSNVSGVIGIVNTGAQVAEHGSFLKFIYFLGVISINLAVMNLLPIPVLDGGHLVFLAYEKITGKPLPEKAQTVAFIVGLSLLGALMLYATWNDLVKLLG